MFHACVQRFDGMDEKFFGGELNQALGLAQIYLNGLCEIQDLVGFVNLNFLKWKNCLYKKFRS